MQTPQKQRADCSDSCQQVFVLLGSRNQSNEMSSKKDANRAQVVEVLCLSFNWHEPCQAVPGMLAINCEALVEILKHSTGSQST